MGKTFIARHHVFRILALFFAMVITVPAFSSNKTIPFSFADAKQLQGHYSTAFGYFYVHIHNNQLITDIEGKRIYLRKKEDGLIYPIYKLFGFIPLSKGDMAFSVRQEKGKQRVFVHTQKKGKKHEQEIGEKFSSVDISTVWKQRIGKYKLLKKGEVIKGLTLKLEIKNKVLLGTRSDRNTTYPLLPHSDLSAIVPGSEGHIVEVFSKNNKLFLNHHKKLYHLVKLP